MRPFKPHKYKAKKTGSYASKREAQYAEQLTLLKNTGKILGWLEQVPIKLPGTKYVVDFMIIGADGTVRFVEVKGHATEAWKLKMRMLRELRPEIADRLEVLT